MSPVTNLKAMHMVDKPRATAAILEAVEKHSGNVRNAADELQCSYHTLWRLIVEDVELARRVRELRKRLADMGFSHKGWKE